MAKRKTQQQPTPRESHPLSGTTAPEPDADTDNDDSPSSIELLESDDEYQASAGSSDTDAPYDEVNLDKVREAFAPFFFRAITAVYVMIAACLIMTFVIILLPDEQVVDKASAATLIHVGLGMVLGLASISFGVVMSWVGIEAPLKLGAKAGANGAPIGFVLQSVGPGTVLLIGGMVLVGMSLYLPMEIRPSSGGGAAEFKGRPVQQRTIDPNTLDVNRGRGVRSAEGRDEPRE